MKQGKWKMLFSIFLTMFNIGAFTFGGGLSMIPQMTRVFVTKKRWVEESEIVDMFAVSQSLPGVIAVNASMLIGYRLCGFAGAMAAALGAILPSFIILIGVTVFYQEFLHNEIVRGVLRGVSAAVVALLFSAAWGLRKKSLTGLFGLVIFAIAMVLILWLDVNPIWLLLGGGGAGLAASIVKIWQNTAKGAD